MYILHLIKCYTQITCSKAPQIFLEGRNIQFTQPGFYLAFTDYISVNKIDTVFILRT